MAIQKLLGALVALASVYTATAADTAVKRQREYNAAHQLVVTIMPSELDLASAQERLRAFLIEQDSQIVRDQPGEIEARTPFAVDPNEAGVDVVLGGVVMTDTARKAQEATGMVLWKRRVIRLSQEPDGPVKIEWCHKTTRHVVQGVATPVWVVCKVSFLEWQMLREITEPLSHPGTTPVTPGFG